MVGNKKQMEKYTEALKTEKELALQKGEMSDNGRLYIDIAKENAHKVAIECLDTILTPELKVFIKNLCFNRLAYPDEPIFYEMFGEYPEVGDKVSEDELCQKKINIQEIDDLIDIWFLEGNWVEREVIDGKKYFVINGLQESDTMDSEEKREWLRNSFSIKKFLLGADLDSKEKKKFFDLLDSITPMIGKFHI